MRIRFGCSLVLLSISLSATPLAAQDADRAAVLTVVNNVFTAMRTRDTALLRLQFDTSARLIGVARRGSPRVTLTSPTAFGNAFAGAPAGNVWNERMYDPEVKIDGNVAQVWGYYTFHLNDKFSHCGVDAFMLLKVGDAWRITQLADTERSDGCTHTEAPKP
jgi:hypothetical protein